MHETLSPRSVVTPEELVNGQNALVRDSAWANLSVAFSGGVVFVSFAMWLGATPLELGLLASISLISQAAQAPAIALVESTRARKRIVVTALMLARALIGAMALIAFWPIADHRLPLLLAAHLLVSILGSVAGCALNSWLHDLLPKEGLGSFFSRRLFAGTVVGCLGTLACGWLIDHPPLDRPEVAYAVAFGIAAWAGFVSVAWLVRCPEPAMPPTRQSEPLVDSLLRPFLDRDYRPLLWLLAAWNLASNLSAPFITVYLIAQMNYSLSIVTSLWVTSQLANALTLYLWGGLPDRLTNKAVLSVAFPVYFLCIFSLVFIGAGSSTLQLAMLYGLHVVMGAAGGGIALAIGNLGLKFAPAGRGTSYLAAAALVAAVAGGLTPTLAGGVADWFEVRNLEIVVRWQSPSFSRDVTVLGFRHWEFLFALSALAGLLVLHTLSRIREGREISERQVVQELALETLRTADQLSSIGGVIAGLFNVDRDTARTRPATERGVPASRPEAPS
jgi:MFS family permease